MYATIPRLFRLIFGSESTYPTKEYSTEDPVNIAHDVTSSDSLFDDSIRYKSKPVLSPYKREFCTADYQSYFLRSRKDNKTDKYYHQIYVILTYYGNWRCYDRARFNEEKTGKVIRMSDDVPCDVSKDHIEEIIVDFQEGFLELSIDIGFTLHVYSISGHENIVIVPSNYVNGYLIGIGAK